MPKKKKKLSLIDQIKEIGAAKISALTIFVVIISIIVNLAFSNFSSDGGNSNMQIAKWIAKNPKAIIESVTAMQKAEMEKAEKEQRRIVEEQIPAKMGELINDKLDGSFTNGKADVHIVEFFDYNCGYCKRVESTLSELKSEKNIKIIYKEYPILGKASEELAKVAIAVNIAFPSKYSLFHHKLMKSSARTKEEAIKIAGGAGINVASLKSALTKNAKKINDKIAKNRELARSLGINGTPAFIIGKELIPGAVGIEDMKKAIQKARKNK